MASKIIPKEENENVSDSTTEEKTVVERIDEQDFQQVFSALQKVNVEMLTTRIEQVENSIRNLNTELKMLRKLKRAL